MKKTADIKKQYFMDDAREGGRLARKVNANEFVEKFLKKDLDNLPGANILEAGCGPGVFLHVLGNNYPKDTIVGIDISEDRIEQANQKMGGLPNVKAINADIYQLPFPDNYFDLIYSRFLFEYLKNPIAASKELYRVCKPGGKLILQDLDGQFTFYPALSEKLQAILQVLKQHTGFDPDIGRKLFSIGRCAGFSFLNIETEMYHKVFGRIDDINYDLWNLKLDIAFKNMQSLLGESAEKLKTEILASLLDKDSVMFSNLFTLTFQKLL